MRDPGRLLPWAGGSVPLSHRLGAWILTHAPAFGESRARGSRTCSPASPNPITGVGKSLDLAGPRGLPDCEQRADDRRDSPAEPAPPFLRLRDSLCSPRPLGFPGDKRGLPAPRKLGFSGAGGQHREPSIRPAASSRHRTRRSLPGRPVGPAVSSLEWAPPGPALRPSPYCRPPRARARPHPDPGCSEPPGGRFPRFLRLGAWSPEPQPRTHTQGRAGFVPGAHLQVFPLAPAGCSPRDLCHPRAPGRNQSPAGGQASPSASPPPCLPAHLRNGTCRVLGAGLGSSPVAPKPEARMPVPREAPGCRRAGTLSGAFPSPALSLTSEGGRSAPRSQCEDPVSVHACEHTHASARLPGPAVSVPCPLSCRHFHRRLFYFFLYLSILKHSFSLTGYN